MTRLLTRLCLVVCAPAWSALLWQVPQEQPLPPLCAMSWQPDLFIGANLQTMDQAAARLRAAVDAAPGAEPLWIRLDAFDLCQVGDCESCQPPPEDPHRVVADAPPPELQPGHLRFAALAAKGLAGSRARPYLVVPAGQMPPPDYQCAGLLALLASPPLSALRDPASYDQRRAQLDAWTLTGADARHLITDGMAELGSLPLCSDLLREQARELRPSLLLARDREHATTLGPAPLARRLRAVAVDGATVAEADRWRADDPDTARLLDVLAALDPLPDGERGELARLTLACLRAGAAWDTARSAGGELPSGLTDLLAQRATLAARLSVAPPASGPLSPAWQAFVARAEPLPRVTLPRLANVTIDGERAEGEWDGALRLMLTRDDLGQPSARPAEVWLALSGERLVATVIATEPKPAEATLRDRLVISLAGADPRGPRVRVMGDVGGQTSLERLPAPGGQPVTGDAEGARCLGLFDGPGWSLELSVPLATLGLDAAGPWRLNVASEHRRGREHHRTLWLPTVGGAWQHERNGHAALK